MKVLFLLTVKTLIRHFEGVSVGLADRGHTVRIATPPGRDEFPWPESFKGNSRISEATCPGRREDEWKDAVHLLRSFADYARYLDGPFLPAQKLRDRAFRTLVKAATDDTQTHAWARCPSCDARIVDDALGRFTLGVGEQGLSNLKDLLRLIESEIPSDKRHEAFLQSEQPDVILVSPLISLGSLQADFVKSAKALKIPVGFPVFSWDNLTTKGIVHVQPDRVFVWNDVQKDEAVRFHGVASDRVVVTGAPRFDEFYDLKPRTTRKEFCDKYGLDPARPILTYLCSSEFVADGEETFVRQWIDEIRKEPGLGDCGIAIRPHPRTLKEWRRLDFSALRNVGVAASPFMNADQLLYDTLFHSAAAVGLNTSAQLEAGILGKPVFTMLAKGFEKGQQGTLHFRYLLKEHGGFVNVAKSFDEHRRHLLDAVAGRYDSKDISNFVRDFIRPAGLDKPATPLLIQAIEQLAAQASAPRVRRWLLPRSSQPTT